MYNGRRKMAPELGHEHKETRERKKMVLVRMLMAVRQEAQVEKAFRRPQAECILKMVTTIKT